MNRSFKGDKYMVNFEVRAIRFHHRYLVIPDYEHSRKLTNENELVLNLKPIP